jgi:hypothetical protein
LAKETEVLGENLLPCRFVHHKLHMLPRGELGLPRWEASDNRLSYGTAKMQGKENVSRNQKFLYDVMAVNIRGVKN